jgi:hypothetical protein
MTAAKLAKEIMGPDAERFQYKLKSGRHTGFRVSFSDEMRKDASKLVTRWWRKAHAAGLQLFVGKSQFQLGPGEYADSWAGASWDPATEDPPPVPDPADFPPTVLPVFALPDIDALEVVEFAAVGTHNDWDALLADDMLGDTGSQEKEWMLEALTSMGGMRKFVDAERKRLKITGKNRQQQVLSGLKQLAKAARFAITFADPAGLKARFLNPLSDEAAMKAAEIIFVLSPEAYDCAPEEIAQRIANREQFRLWWD